MAKIKRILYNKQLVYPLTISDAVIDVSTGKSLTKTLEDIKYETITDKDIQKLIEDG